MKKLFLLVCSCSCSSLLAQSVVPMRYNNSTNVLVEPTAAQFKAANTISSTGTITALGGTTALAADTTYTGPISTRTFTLPSAASSSNQVIRYAGTAAASTVITWPASTVRQVGSSGYASSTTFAIGNAEFSLWSDGTDWYLADSTGSGSGSLTSPVGVADGGTGVTSLTAYAPIFGGTTSTAPVQSGTAGTAGHVLTSNGAGALPTFQAAGSGSLPAGGSLRSVLKTDGSAAFWSDLSNTIDFKDDFFYGSATTAGERWGASGTVSFAATGAATANHWGILRFRSTGADQVLFTAGSVPDHIVLGSGTVSVEWIIKTVETSALGTGSLSDATDNYTLVVGLGDTITSAGQTDGVFFRYNHAVNSGKWERVTESNTSEEALDTGVAYAGATWIRLGMLITDATSVQFFINGTSVGTNSTGANIPSGITRTLGILYNFDRTAGAAERNMFIDAFHLVFKPTTPR